MARGGEIVCQGRHRLKFNLTSANVTPLWMGRTSRTESTEWLEPWLLTPSPIFCGQLRRFVKGVLVPSVITKRHQQTLLNPRRIRIYSRRSTDITTLICCDLFTRVFHPPVAPEPFALTPPFFMSWSCARFTTWHSSPPDHSIARNMVTCATYDPLTTNTIQ